ncbi:NnrU family protein [Azorhizobium doebereinerae]|uniref:NnrU family protein n=1 Tax=Azorhizobium doebereinerae TaxID=281091 RepID=UPI00040E283C|nr:NnrU family protein [Azorhizobium doebereinerae]
MAMMLLGLVLFLGVHVVSSLPGLRAGLIAQVGEGPYKGFYSLLAASGVLLTAYGYGLWRAAGPAVLWTPPLAMRHVTMGLMLLAAIALVAAYVPSHIKAKLKHPMLVGVKIWALAHLLSNGDVASVVLFGAVLAWAVYDRISVKRRQLPLPVVPQGWTGDVGAVVGGIVLYLVLAFVFHPLVVGVPVMG